jgi:ribosomal protein S27E
VSTRYRCNACGNLTRFDVVAQRRTRSFHHYSIGGDLQVEDEVVLDEAVEDVSCRWCGTGASVEPVDVLEAVDVQGPGPEAT